MKRPKAEGLPPGEPVFDVADTVSIELGSAESLDTERELPVCVLWIFDPEQRHFLREYYVKKQAPKPSGKLIGFRKKP